MVGAIIIPLAVIVVVGIVVVLIIRWAIKKKKVSSEVSHPSEVLPPSDKAQVAKTQDGTQFWVCPNCGNNTQMKDERQYCPSCKIYLSI